MNEPTINCPKCKAAIKLTEAVAGPAIAEMRAKLERESSERSQAIELREADLERRKQDVEELIRNRTTVAVEAGLAKVQEQSKAEVLALKKEISANEAKLAGALSSQATAERMQRELADEKRQLDLTIERRVTEQAASIRTTAARQAEEQNRLVIAERDRTIEKMREDLSEAQRRADEGSQKAQGEVLELNFEATLRQRFPEDAISAVADRLGQGDLHQQVRLNGKDRGLLLWELKRTKLWADAWLPKLRGIQREMKASFAIVCSNVLPEGVETFELIDGVWVCAPRYAFAVAAMLRHWLIDVDRVRIGNEGQKTKAEAVYQYMTGPSFRHRVEAIVEPFQEMKEDLDRERRGTTKMWAKRGTQLEQVMDALAGLYGDLQGIAGSQVAELPALALGPEQGKL